MKLTIKTFLTLLVFFSVQFNIAQTLDPDSLVGTYLGMWDNSTFSSSGDASLESSLIEGSFSMQLFLDFDGFLGGLLDPDTITLLGTLSSSVITIDTTLVEGDLFLTWDANGVFEWEFTNITTLGINSATGTGTGTSQEINVDYTVWLTGGIPAIGTAQLTKQASSIEDQINNLGPDSYILFNNYPNPFNPSTTIYFSIPEAGKVSLRVYSVIGEEVAELLDEHISRGIHNIEFNASNLPSGVYLYRMTAESFSQTKKMILIK